MYETYDVNIVYLKITSLFFRNNILAYLSKYNNFSLVFFELCFFFETFAETHNAMYQ